MKNSFQHSQLPTLEEERTSKRELKSAEKENHILKLYFDSKMKPSAISKKLRVTTHMVYGTVQKAKLKVKDFIKTQERSEEMKQSVHDLDSHSIDTATLPKRRKNKRVDDPQLLSVIKDSIEANGIHRTTLTKVRNHIKQELPNVYPPSLTTLSTILRKEFCLSFGKCYPANARYKDPIYDEKRLWISRLLSHMLMENTVIISIDESNFRSRMTNSCNWDFNSSIQKRRVRKMLEKQQDRFKS